MPEMQSEIMTDQDVDLINAWMDECIEERRTEDTWLRVAEVWVTFSLPDGGLFRRQVKDMTGPDWQAYAAYQRRVARSLHARANLN